MIKIQIVALKIFGVFQHIFGASETRGTAHPAHRQYLSLSLFQYILLFCAIKQNVELGTTLSVVQVADWRGFDTG